MAKKSSASELKAQAGQVMSSEMGRSFMWRILSEGGIFRGSFTGNSTTFFREGQRDLALKIFNALQLQPEQFLMMWKENAPDAEPFKVLGLDDGAPTEESQND